MLAWLATLLALSLGTLAATSAEGAKPASLAEDGGECVILLHGLWRTGLSMKPLEWRLEQDGYQVSNVTYPSILYPIEELAEQAMARGISRCREQDAHTLYIVTHSLGGILVRQYLQQHDVRDLKRVVMLGPPNQGSQMADYYEGLAVLDFLTPVAVAQLTTGGQSLPQSLGPVNFEVGVIAGNINRRPTLLGVPKQPSDGTVTIEETRVEGMADFLVLPTSHSFMMLNDEVIRQVLFFLAHGHFHHAVASEPEQLG